MFDSFLDRDIRDADARRQSLIERQSAGAAEHLPPLQMIIESCMEQNDRTLRAAFEYWINSISNRGLAFNRDVARHIKIPHVLRAARGLASQDVLLLPNDELWSLVGGQKHVLLYSPS